MVDTHLFSTKPFQNAARAMRTGGERLRIPTLKYKICTVQQNVYPVFLPLKNMLNAL
jgi:hypothetical protein